MNHLPELSGQLESLVKLLLKTGESLRNLHTRTYSRGPEPRATWAQVRVMGCVLFTPQGQARVKDISRELGITPGAVSQIVEELVRSGMVKRTVNEQDRRGINISLSQEGIRMRTMLDAEFTTLLGRLLQQVPKEKIQICHEVLQALDTALEAEKQI